MNATRTDLDLARQLYQPSVESRVSHLPDLGESLHSAAIDLARDCTLEGVDQMLARIKGAETTLVHIRKALATEGVSPDVVV